MFQGQTSGRESGWWDCSKRLTRGFSSSAGDLSPSPPIPTRPSHHPHMDPLSKPTGTSPHPHENLPIPTGDLLPSPQGPLPSPPPPRNPRSVLSRGPSLPSSAALGQGRPSLLWEESVPSAAHATAPLSQDYKVQADCLEDLQSPMLLSTLTVRPDNTLGKARCKAAAWPGRPQGCWRHSWRHERGAVDIGLSASGGPTGGSYSHQMLHQNPVPALCLVFLSSDLEPVREELAS